MGGASSSAPSSCGSTPDLLPDRAALRSLRVLDWVNLAALGALLVSAAWWLVGLLGA